MTPAPAPSASGPSASGPERGADRGAGEPRAHLVRGDDPAIVAQEVRSLVGRLVGERDPALVAEEHGWVSDELDVARVIDALTTPPFLVDTRVVVLREAGRLSAADGRRLAEALAHPAPGCHLVLVGGGGTVPRPLLQEMARVGASLDASVGTGRDRSRWLTEQLRASPIHLSSGAVRLVADHLGDDLGRLDPLLETLVSAYGEGASLGEGEVGPFLGEAGSVPPWELTDAVDRGGTEAALGALQRMLVAGGRSAPEVIGLLHRHFDQMLRLDGAGVVGPEDASKVLGVRSAYVAKKALASARRLGPERLAEAVVLLAGADQDVKGRTGLPDHLVLQVLVARLSRLSRSPATAARAGRRGQAVTPPRRPRGR